MCKLLCICDIINKDFSNQWTCFSFVFVFFNISSEGKHVYFQIKYGKPLEQMLFVNYVAEGYMCNPGSSGDIFSPAYIFHMYGPDHHGGSGCGYYLRHMTCGGHALISNTYLYKQHTCMASPVSPL